MNYKILYSIFFLISTLFILSCKRKKFQDTKWEYKNGIGFHFLDTLTNTPKPKKGEQVTLHYVCYSEYQDIFERTMGQTDPLTFTIGDGSVLPSFDYAIQQFERGQAGYFKIPPELAYGDKEKGIIPPNSTLIYYVEMEKTN